MSRRTILFVLFILCCSRAFGQRILIKGEETNRKLVWTDFTGPIDVSSQYDANTYYDIRMSTSSKESENGKETLTNFIVTLELNSPKSWTKSQKQTEELLVHEQGHFNLGILCMYEIIEKINKLKINKNANKLVNKMFERVFDKYAQLNLRYDRETEHSKNKEKQLKWNKYFQENLEKRNHKF